MTASRYYFESIPPSVTPSPNGRPMSSAASMPRSRCCCAGRSTRPDECRKEPGRCPSGADHPPSDPHISPVVASTRTGSGVRRRASSQEAVTCLSSPLEAPEHGVRRALVAHSPPDLTENRFGVVPTSEQRRICMAARHAKSAGRQPAGRRSVRVESSSAAEVLAEVAAPRAALGDAPVPIPRRASGGQCCP
jgi:hypothetical protein